MKVLSRKEILFTLYLVLGVFGLSPSLYSEETITQITPIDPVLAIPADFCEWTVTFTSKVAPAPLATPGITAPALTQEAIKKLVFTKVSKWGKDRRLVNRWSDGTETENWIKGPYIIFNTSKKSDVYIFNTKQLVGLGDLGEMLVDYQANEFPELAWVSSTCFKKIEPLHDRKCFLFAFEETPSESPRFNITTAIKKSKKAWVDVETGFPVRLEINDETRDYIFLKTIPVLEPLPESFQKEFDRYMLELTPPKIKKP